MQVVMKIVYDLMDTCCTGLTKLIIGQERDRITQIVLFIGKTSVWKLLTPGYEEYI